MKAWVSYRALFPYLRPHLPRFLIGCGFMVASAVFNGASLGLLVPLVDRVFARRPIPVLSAWPQAVQRLVAWLNGLDPSVVLSGVAVAALIALIAKSLFEALQNYVMNDVALSVLRDIRDGLYEHLMGLSLGYYTDARAGTLVSRVTYDVSVIQNSLTEGLAEFVKQLAQVSIMMTFLFFVDWKLACVAFVWFPAIAFPIVRIGRLLKKISTTVQERMADINSTLVESFSGIGVIKAFGLERLKLGTFRRQNLAYYKANVRTIKRMAALGSLTEVISTSSGLAVLVIGGQRVMTGQISAGLFTFFIASLGSLVQPFKKLSRLHSVNQQAMGAAERVLEVLRTRPTVEEAPDAVAIAPLSRQVRFEQISFRYPTSTDWVLRDVSLEAARGELVALVGPSGAGKTTLANLIPRFYDPTEGQVLLDGTDLRRVTLESLRHQIGIVTQETFLFHDTVRTNIAFGYAGATEAEVVAAAKAANAHEFISRLPQGYDTLIGERGLRLSGGERQRLAIARAILRNPPILILDEATSQLDTESERLVQEALERVTEGRTAFVIAHRLSTVRRATRIVVLERGRILEVGRHEELVARSGLYRRLCELQFADVAAR